MGWPARCTISRRYRRRNTAGVRHRRIFCRPYRAVLVGVSFPGRCPGLCCDGPSGRKEIRIDFTDYSERIFARKVCMSALMYAKSGCYVLVSPYGAVPVGVSFPGRCPCAEATSRIGFLVFTSSFAPTAHPNERCSIEGRRSAVGGWHPRSPSITYARFSYRSRMKRLLFCGLAMISQLIVQGWERRRPRLLMGEGVIGFRPGTEAGALFDVPPSRWGRVAGGDAHLGASSTCAPSLAGLQFKRDRSRISPIASDG